jgi:hypothetical protein
MPGKGSTGRLPSGWLSSWGIVTARKAPRPAARATRGNSLCRLNASHSWNWRGTPSVSAEEALEKQFRAGRGVFEVSQSLDRSLSRGGSEADSRSLTAKAQIEKPNAKASTADISSTVHPEYRGGSV